MLQSQIIPMNQYLKFEESSFVIVWTNIWITISVKGFDYENKAVVNETLEAGRHGQFPFPLERKTFGKTKMKNEESKFVFRPEKAIRGTKGVSSHPARFVSTQRHNK